MLIERTQATAIRTLSVRTDEDTYTRVKTLAASLHTSPSVLLRIAIRDLLAKARMDSATNLAELLTRAA
jgi:predicted transcriptional regulator